MEDQQYVLSDPVEEVVEIVPGTKKTKDPLTEGQKRQGTFAVRMESSLKQIEALENAGFNPVNLYDIIVNNLPVVPDSLERWLSSAEYKQYERAKMDFSTAVLRQETGAVINDTEIIWINKTYFPEFGDDRQTILNKRQARRDALAGMITQSGAAYEKTKKGAIQNEYGFESEQALEELIKRSETDPELKQKLVEKGLLDE